MCPKLVAIIKVVKKKRERSRAKVGKDLVLVGKKCGEVAVDAEDSAS